MLNLIQSQTKKIMYDCCKKFAASKNKSLNDVQLILSVREQDEELVNTYTLCVDFAPEVEYSILEVLGVKIDFRGFSIIAPPFIRKSICRFAEKYQKNPCDLKIMCVAEANKNVNLYLYNQFEFLEEIDFAQLFSEEDIEIPN